MATGSQIAPSVSDDIDDFYNTPIATSETTTPSLACPYGVPCSQKVDEDSKPLFSLPGLESVVSPNVDLGIHEPGLVLSNRVPSAHNASEHSKPMFCLPGLAPSVIGKGILNWHRLGYQH